MFTADMRQVDPGWRWNSDPVPATKPPYKGIDVGEHNKYPDTLRRLDVLHHVEKLLDSYIRLILMSHNFRTHVDKRISNKNEY